MNDLIKLLRGRRIDGRSADEIMRLAADEVERLRRELTEARKAIELAARALHGDGMADQGEAFDTAARILDAFLAGEKS